jgi:hypothetical protein
MADPERVFIERESNGFFWSPKPYTLLLLFFFKFAKLQTNVLSCILTETLCSKSRTASIRFNNLEYSGMVIQP